MEQEPQAQSYRSGDLLESALPQLLHIASLFSNCCIDTILSEQYITRGIKHGIYE